MKDKSEDFKIFEVDPTLQAYIQESESNLLSVEGIEMRVNRSIQVEGAFGIIKQDLAYERFRRRSLKKTSAEFMLVCLGFNIRKLFRHFSGKPITTKWVVPKGTKPEEKKKPSAKRLCNRVNRKKTK